jgi:hypothetical protein
MWWNYWENVPETICIKVSRHGKNVWMRVTSEKASTLKRTTPLNISDNHEPMTLIFAHPVGMVTIIWSYESLILILRTVQNMSVCRSFSTSRHHVSSLIRNIRIHLKLMIIYSLHATIICYNNRHPTCYNEIQTTCYCIIIYSLHATISLQNQSHCLLSNAEQV